MIALSTGRDAVKGIADMFREALEGGEAEQSGELECFATILPSLTASAWMCAII